MSSSGHADTDTLAETIVDHGDKDYQELADDNETLVSHDNKSLKFKNDSDADSLALVKADALARYAAFSGESSRTPRPILFRVIGGLGSLPSRAMRSVNSLAQRMLALCNAEMQVRGVVLANAAVIQRRVSQKGKLASTSRNFLSDVGPKQSLVRDKIRSIQNTLQAAKSHNKAAPVDTYKDLLLLLCTVLRAPANTYNETLGWRVWDTLTDELLGRHVHLVAEAMSAPECMDEDIGTLLRHLALARLSGWKKHRALNTLDPASIFSLARSASFSSETYDDYLALNEGFFTLLLEVTSRRPVAVREAFDHYIHLVWFKYAITPPLMSRTPPTTTCSAPQIKFSYVLDNIAYMLCQFEKRLDPSLPREARSFVHLLTCGTAPAISLEGAPAQEYVKCATAHVRKTLACIADASKPLPTSDQDGDFDPAPTCFHMEGMYELFQEHPGFALGSLVHPTLPILLFVAELVENSPRASASLLDNSNVEGTRPFLESLRILWMRSFLLPWDYPWGIWHGTGPGPGRWVQKEKRSYALRLATCLVLANLAKAAHRALREGDPEPMKMLAESVTARRKVEAWFWDAAAATLYFHIHFTELHLKNLRAVVPLSKEKQAETDIYGLYALSLQHIRPLIAYLTCDMDRKPPTLKANVLEMDPESLVWVFEDVPAELGCKALSSILTCSTASTEWSIALEILGACDSYNQDNFRKAIGEFMLSLLSSRVKAPRRVSRVLMPTMRSHNMASDPPPLFMPHPADRFLMLLAGAIRRNGHIGIALQRDDNTKELLKRLLCDIEGGRFDSDISAEGRSPSPLDTEQREWRTRTCQALWCVLG